MTVSSYHGINLLTADAGQVSESEVDMSSDEDSNLCDRPVAMSGTAWDGQEPQDESDTEYWSNANRLAMQALGEMTRSDANISENKYPDIVNKIVRMTMRAWAEHDALPIEQQTGCEMPGCQCNGRVEFMFRGSEDIVIGRKQTIRGGKIPFTGTAGLTGRIIIITSCQRGWPLRHIPLPYEGTRAGSMGIRRDEYGIIRKFLMALGMREPGPVRTLPGQTNRWNRT